MIVDQSHTSHYDAAERALAVLRDPIRMPLREGGGAGSLIPGAYEIASITAIGALVHATLALVDELRTNHAGADPQPPIPDDFIPPSRRGDFD